MEAMQRALEVPHMTFCDEVDADRLGQLRSDLTEAAERRGARLSYLPLIVKVRWAARPYHRRWLRGEKKALLDEVGVVGSAASIHHAFTPCARSCPFSGGARCLLVVICFSLPLCPRRVPWVGRSPLAWL